ncbi:GEM-like protein 5 [Magnolia sinica]|uniref:GEM-like protein 5 n=1 Tax=Magnolia sinica TaxID=86752 RepID=UPI00265B7114|nr:GEM-like protein 5 [Magnolia sinica]
MNTKGEEKQPLQQPAGESSPSEKWGTKYMGPPAPPSAHPLNQQAATWTAWDEQHPYVLGHTEGGKSNNSPLESVLHTFNEWGKKAETMTSNIWHNLKTGPSVSEAAWGKLSLTAKAITEGGFESLYKQTFPTDPVEKLKKTFACYLSTSTGPVAGTLYLSNVNIAFCSDRPLTFTAPSGQQAWFHYKVLVPLARIDSINPVIMKENPSEKYIQIGTIDGHDFWFMGFVNYEKACTHLSGALSDFVASIKRTEPPVSYP